MRGLFMGSCKTSATKSITDASLAVSDQFHGIPGCCMPVPLHPTLLDPGQLHPLHAQGRQKTFHICISNPQVLFAHGHPHPIVKLGATSWQTLGTTAVIFQVMPKHDPEIKTKGSSHRSGSHPTSSQIPSNSRAQQKTTDQRWFSITAPFHLCTGSLTSRSAAGL